MSIPDLPELPSRDDVLARREHYARIVAEAQAEVEKADAWLALIDGKPRRKAKRRAKRSEAGVSEATYRAAIEDLANRRYAGTGTIAEAIRVSDGHVGQIMRVAVRRGHAETKRNGKHGNRHQITEAGLEFATGSEEPRANGNGHGRVSMPELTAGLRNAL
jgi:hypothetical protein